MEAGKRRLCAQAAFLLFLIVGSVVVISNHRNAPYQQNTGTIFGTVYHVTYQSGKDLSAEITGTLNRVDSSLSMFNERSVISRVNRGEQTEADNMLAEVFTLAQEVSEKTGGAFDITVAPIVNAWGFGFKKGTEPTREAIDSLLQITGYEKVSLYKKGGKSHIRKADGRVMLDCSAIAKGYGADAVAALLASRGVENYMVEIGGEVVTRGKNPKRQQWRIGISKPTDDSLGVSQDLQTVLKVSDAAMATSGNYRNFYYKDGKKYAHTIDPKTGRPVQHSLLSSTVVARSCAIADAYATAFMVMGMEKAKETLEKDSSLAAYFIYTDGNGRLRTWFSPAIKGMLQDE